ncbi:MAG: hypothetical protein R3F11_03525 [Verrucomicrobiales bacterium]
MIKIDPQPDPSHRQNELLVDIDSRNNLPTEIPERNQKLPFLIDDQSHQKRGCHEFPITIQNHEKPDFDSDFYSFVPLTAAGVAVMPGDLSGAQRRTLRSFESPSGKAKIVVYSLEPLFPVFFGSASDCEAFVTLESLQGTVFGKNQNKIAHSEHRGSRLVRCSLWCHS